MKQQRVSAKGELSSQKKKEVGVEGNLKIPTWALCFLWLCLWVCAVLCIGGLTQSSSKVHLNEANFLGIAAEALSAAHQPVLSDDSMRVPTHTTVKSINCQWIMHHNPWLIHAKYRRSQWLSHKTKSNQGPTWFLRNKETKNYRQSKTFFITPHKIFASSARKWFKRRNLTLLSKDNKNNPRLGSKADTLFWHFIVLIPNQSLQKYYYSNSRNPENASLLSQIYLSPSFTRFLYLNHIVSVEIEPEIPSLGTPHLSNCILR